MIDELGKIGKAAGKAFNKNTQRAERKVLNEAKRNVVKAGKEVAEEAYQTFKHGTDVYLKKNGQYFISQGGGSFVKINESAYQEALAARGLKGAAKGAKEGAEGALGGIRSRMDDLGTRASERLGVSKGVGNAIAGGTVGGATGMIVGGTVAAVDGNDNTTVMGGALGGAFIGGAAGGLYGGLMGFESVAKEIAEGEAVHASENAAKDLGNAESVAKSRLIGKEEADTTIEKMYKEGTYKEGKGGQSYFGDTEPVEPKPSLYKQEADGQVAMDIATGNTVEQQVEGQQSLEQLFPEVMNPGKKEPASAVLPDGPEGEQMDFFDMLNSKE